MPPDTGSLFSFFAGAPASSGLSYPAMEARRKIALQMLANSGRKGYPKTFGEGLTAVGDAIGDIGMMRSLGQQETAFQKQAAAAAEGAIPSEAKTPAAPGPQSAAEPETDTAKPTAYAATDTTATEPAIDRTATPAVATATPAEVEPGVTGPGYNPLDAAAGADPWLAHRKALAAIETGGEKDPYAALGKVIPKTGDRAYGMYQIMGANIPQWTQAATGQALTPQQFLASPAAQEATAKHRFTGYVDKYGDEGAARAWYAGEHGMDKLDHTDVHERLSVRDYGRDFMNKLGPYMRDRIATAATPQPDTQPSAALPLSTTSDQPSDLPSEITRGFSATPQAQAQIRAAPPLRMAQATPSPAQVTAGREAPPAKTLMGADEKRGYQIRAQERAMGIPPEMQQGQGLIDLGVREREQRDAVLMQDWRDRMQMAHQRQLAKEAFEQGAPVREQEAAIRQEALVKSQRENALRAQFGNMEPGEVFKHMDNSAKVARSAVQSLTASQAAMEAFRGGAITGATADWKLAATKFLSGMGAIDASTKIANTEVFKGAMQPVIASILHQTSGTSQLSEGELYFAKQAAAGNITLDEKTIPRLMEIIDKASRNTIAEHQNKLDTLFPDNPQAKAMFGAEAPKASDPLEGKTATGPNGHQLIRRNGQWVEK